MLRIVRNKETGEWEPWKNPRAPQARWDRRHLVTVSTHLTRKQWETLRRVCARNHVTVYAIVRDFLHEYIRVHSDA